MHVTPQLLPLSASSEVSSSYSPLRIASLDPLDADRALRVLPSMNARADVRAIVKTLSYLIPSVERLSDLPVDEASAMMRDIGLFLGSLKRHGIEPVEVLPELEPVLLMLGRRTDMIPRDTVFHYTEWNPAGVRRRTYTGENQEIFLRDATHMTLSHLADAVVLCRHLSDTELDNEKTPELLNTLAVTLDSFDTSIKLVMSKVSPQFFAEVLRPYFQEIQVGDQKYLGPAASHVPLFLIDLALWASDHSLDEYADFRQDSTLYTLPQWRALALKWENSPSFLSRLNAALTVSRPGVSDQFQASLEAFGTVMRTLIRFRGKHLTFARMTYSTDVCAYEAGSGGGTIDLLQQILSLTRQNQSPVRDEVETGGGRLRYADSNTSVRGPESNAE